MKLLIILLPFLGTTLGSAFVYLLKNKMSRNIEKQMLSFSAGIMLAASIFSLILPALESNKIILVILGILSGLFTLILINKYTKGITNDNKKLLMLAIVIHNIPEGIAVGIAYSLNLIEAFSISMGIAIQNIPEGSIISMPLKCSGVNKHKAFIIGVLSGIVEPIASIIAILLTSITTPVQPFLLAFAAGAMIYVTIKELIPESITDDKNSTVFFIGFIIMMALDVLLG